MLRQRPHRTARRVLAHPATCWLLLSVLYGTAVVLNVLLAVRAGLVWPLLLAVVLGAAAVACSAMALRRLR